MNKLEELSSGNKQNYIRYLKRMTDSLNFSTKGLIPYFASEGKNILDVGCGSGVLLSAVEKENPEAQLTGIDLNIDAVNELKRSSNWNVYHMNFFDLKDARFDTIIFSSILHEISSYAEAEEERFTESPIIRAFNRSYDLLTDNGSVIVRDGLLCDKESKDRKVVISFNNPTDEYWLHRFKEEFRGFDKTDIDTSIIKLKNGYNIVSSGFLKEFLCTYTWGEESFPREVCERYGILTKEEWVNIINKTGFNIETIIESEEEYEKYLSPKVNLMYTDGTDYNYPNMSILIKARKRTK